MAPEALQQQGSYLQPGRGRQHAEQPVGIEMLRGHHLTPVIGSCPTVAKDVLAVRNMQHTFTGGVA